MNRTHCTEAYPSTEYVDIANLQPDELACNISAAYFDQCSVLGLLLGQSADWKIQTESQHKEWKNMIQK